MKMSKIKIKQIDANTVCVSLTGDTPISMVNELSKNLTAKGMIEDLSKSTVSDRYFYRFNDGADDVAERLIKSLQNLTKADEQTKAQWEVQARNRLAQRNVGRKSSGLAPITMNQMQNPKVATPAPSATPAPVSGPTTISGKPNKLHNPSMNEAAGFKRVNKNEEDEEDIEKSGYGPKKGGQYSPTDNARRKAGNTGDVAGVGPNVNVKAFSTKPGQLSAKASTDLTARLQNKANKKQPVKIFSPEEIEAQYGKQPMKKSWGQHLPFPSAEEEIMNLAKNEPIDGETAAANQLLKLMAGKSMLGQQPPPQPTNEQMFGAGVVTEEMAKAAEHKWNNTFNWMTEAQKPISKRFASEEEEIAYWRNLQARDDGDNSGY